MEVGPRALLGFTDGGAGGAASDREWRGEHGPANSAGEGMLAGEGATRAMSCWPASERWGMENLR